jgi:tetratricopeptide (TPR) repeat protein
MNSAGIKQLLKQATVYLQSGNSTQAKKVLSQILKLNSKSVEAWLLLAKLSLKESSQATAVNAYTEVLKIKPGFEEAVVFLVNHYGSKEKDEDCEKILRGAIKATPNFARYPFMLSNLLLHRGYHAQAIKYQKRALELAPEMKQIKIALAKTYSKHGNLEMALEMFRPFLESTPPDFQAVIEFSNICSPLNMDEDCRALINILSNAPLNAKQVEQLRKSSKMLSQI